MDIVEAADAIGAFVHGHDEAAFLADDLLRSATLHKMTIIGEAAGRLPVQFRRRYPHIPWAHVVGFRNIAVHAYFSVQWSIVWFTATEDVPLLRKNIAAILETEFPTRPSTEGKQS